MPHQAWLLLAAVMAVGVLHTLVPDHWVPITLLARQRGWTRMHTARVAFGAGLGHTISTLAIGIAVWLAGAMAAQRFGNIISIASSVALVGFGAWIAVAAWRALRAHDHAHAHDHGHDHAHLGGATALTLILGSSPMVEGIPAFFAAATFGPGLVVAMAVCFALSTIATYVALCTLSSAVLERLHLGPFERYGEVLSGLFIMLVGIVFGLTNL